MPPVLHHIDEPARWDNPVPLMIVRGWCFATEGPSVVGIRARTAGGDWQGVHGLARADVGAAFNGAPGSTESGFILRLPRPAQDARDIAFEAMLADGGNHPLAVIQIP